MIRMMRRNWTSAARHYSDANAIVVSLGKSGRTWLRVFLHSYFCALENREFTLDSHQLADSRMPKLIFTHDLWGSKTTWKFIDRLRGRHLIPASERRIKPIILLVRDPRDIIVSLYFQVTKRSGHFSGALSEMIRHPKYGIYSIIEVMNEWTAEWSDRKDFKLLRYEDCRKDTEAAFLDVLKFLGVQNIDDSIFAQSLQFSSFDNMKKLEATYKFKAGILSPGNVNDPESFKVRRGVVGGYKDYLDSADVDYINRAMARLDAKYGYSKEA